MICIVQEVGIVSWEFMLTPVIMTVKIYEKDDNDVKKIR